MGKAFASMLINDITVLRSYRLCPSLPVYPLHMYAFNLVPEVVQLRSLGYHCSELYILYQIIFLAYYDICTYEASADVNK